MPHFDKKDMYKPDKRAWSNFLGQEGLYTTRDRVLKVLNINQSVFQQQSSFSDDILELFEKNHLQKDMDIVDYIPREYYRDSLTRHDLEEQKNLHHIIFQNGILCGSKCNIYNHIYMEIGLHSSFHKLLNSESLYPHEQIIKFLKIESEYLDDSFMKRIYKIENLYDKVFENHPFEIYKQECFSDVFRRNYNSLDR